MRPTMIRLPFLMVSSKTLATLRIRRIVIGDYNLVLDTNLDRYGSSYNNKKAAKKVHEWMNEEMMRDMWRIRNPSEIFLFVGPGQSRKQN